MIYKYGKNDIGIDIFFDLLFTFLMRNVSGRAMLQDLTVMQIFSAIFSQLFHFFGCIAEFQVLFKDGLPYLFHSFRNKYFNKISLGNMLYFQINCKSFEKNAWFSDKYAMKNNLQNKM